jgi:hypothetical protein
MPRGAKFSIAEFRAENGSFGPAALDRIRSRTVDITTAQGKLQRAAIAIDNFLAARAELNESMQEVSERYAIQDAFELKDKRY